MYICICVYIYIYIYIYIYTTTTTNNNDNTMLCYKPQRMHLQAAPGCRVILRPAARTRMVLL